MKPLFLVLLLLPGVAALAADAGDTAPAAALPDAPAAAVTVPADPLVARARARELRDRADAERKAAEERYKAEDAACYARFLVNSCRDDAKRARSAALVAARLPEAEAREIERTLRQRELDSREAKRREEAPQRQREAQEQAARNKAEQEAARLRVERRQAERAAGEGR